jgi:hypothetical protein
MGAESAAGVPLLAGATSAATPPVNFPDRTGIWSNLNLSGQAAGQGPFFQSLGSNGRSCASCHAGSAIQ